MRIAGKIIFALFLMYLMHPQLVFSQTELKNNNFYEPNKKYSVTLYGTYISSGEILNNIMSTDPILRDVSVDLNATYGYGFELNFKPQIFNLDLLFYLSAEFMKLDQNDLAYKVDNGFNISTYYVREKYTLIPVEMGIKWPLPVGTDNFKIYIGGGGGFYFGSHKRFYGNLESSPAENKPGFSLNILSGLEYYFMKNVSADFELKFREATFDTQGSYNKKQFQLPDPFYSRLIVDGVRVSAGVKYHF